jgi:hypothetical protein
VFVDVYHFLMYVYVTACGVRQYLSLDQNSESRHLVRDESIGILDRAKEVKNKGAERKMNEIII